MPAWRRDSSTTLRMYLESSTIRTRMLFIKRQPVSQLRSVFCFFLPYVCSCAYIGRDNGKYIPEVAAMLPKFRFGLGHRQRTQDQVRDRVSRRLLEAIS